MLKFDEKDPNPPIKVELDKDKDESKRAYVLLRPATQKKLEEIREKTHTKKFKKIKGIIHEYYDINESMYDSLLWKYCLPGWGNLVGQDKKEIVYSSKKAVWMIKNVPFFSELVGEKLDEVKEIIALKSKTIEGN